MKIIDLLNKIANDELEDTKFIYDGNYCIYHNHTIDVYTDKTYETYDFTYDEVINFICINSLNDEVEIIEDNKIEKIDRDNYVITRNNKFVIEDMFNKINEIIDYLNKEE